MAVSGGGNHREEKEALKEKMKPNTETKQTLWDYDRVRACTLLKKRKERGSRPRTRKKTKIKWNQQCKNMVRGHTKFEGNVAGLENVLRTGKNQYLKYSRNQKGGGSTF